SRRPLAQVVEERGLAGAHLAAHDEHLAPARTGVVEQAVEPVALAVASAEQAVCGPGSGGAPRGRRARGGAPSARGGPAPGPLGRTPDVGFTRPLEVPACTTMPG